MDSTEERVKVKILKAALVKSDLSYAKDALDYINILEKQLLLTGVVQAEPEKVCECGKKEEDITHPYCLKCHPKYGTN